MELKNPLKSKTIWFNLLIALAAFFPAVQAWVQAHPTVILEVIGVVGLILRFLTHGKIGLDPDPGSSA